MCRDCVATSVASKTAARLTTHGGQKTVHDFPLRFRGLGTPAHIAQPHYISVWSDLQVRYRLSPSPWACPTILGRVLHPDLQYHSVGGLRPELFRVCRYSLRRSSPSINENMSIITWKTAAVVPEHLEKQTTNEKYILRVA